VSFYKGGYNLKGLVMEVAHIGKGKDTLLEVPKAPVYLTDEAKKHYSEMGSVLCKNDLLKEKFLPALQVYAEAMAQWEFSLREIKKANKQKYGTGYFQKFASGASNVSVYITLKDKAEDSILKCCKIFGLDPKSEKDLKMETGQYSLFEELMKSKKTS
jgi:P27 family predicted phage terminase small subunit